MKTKLHYFPEIEECRLSFLIELLFVEKGGSSIDDFFSSSDVKAMISSLCTTWSLDGGFFPWVPQFSPTPHSQPISLQSVPYYMCVVYVIKQYILLLVRYGHGGAGSSCSQGSRYFLLLIQALHTMSVLVIKYFIPMN